MDETVAVQNIYIEKWFQERAVNIRNLANIPSSKNLEIDKINHNLEFMLENIDDFDTLHFLNDKGEIIASTALNPTVTDLSDRDYFKEAVKGNEYVTDAFLGRGTGKMVIVFSSPVYDYSNKFIGAIIGSVSLASIDDIIEDIEVSEGKDIYIVNRDGYMITESRFIDQLIAEGKVEQTARMNIKVDTPLFKNALNNEGYRESFVDYRGVEVYGTFGITNDGKWIIISEIDKEQLVIGIQRQIFSFMGWLAIIAMASIIVTLKFTEKIEEPIKYLLEGTTNLQAGNYSHKIDEKVISNGPEELLRLCKAFNEMSSTIDSHIHKIQESEKKYRGLFYHNPNIVFTLDRQGTLQEINTYTEIITGFSKADLIGKPLTTWTSQEDLEKAKISFLKALMGESNNFDMSIVGKSGEKLYFNTTLFPIKVNPTEILIFGIGKDVTEKRLALEELQIYSKKLEQSNGDLQQFAYVASHDLQEPLRMVSSYLQLLEKRYVQNLDHDAQEFIKFAVDGAKRMHKLINDLLAYSRLNTRGNEFKGISTQKVLNKVLNNLEFFITEKNAMVTHENLPEIFGDESQIIQLFQNIIVNGIKFNVNQPRIHISAWETDEHWFFSFKDNGIGIPQEHQGRVFEIFQRLHTKEEYDGTGIGLAICNRIIQRHGGSIWLESQENQGTIFYFTVSKGGSK